MNRVLISLCFVLNCIVPAMGQTNDLEFAAKLNRLNARISIAHMATKTQSSDLELTEQQKGVLIELRKRHQLMMKKVKTFGADEKEDAKQFLMEKVSELENELTTSILLPHQVAQVNERIFERQLTAYGGNLVQVLLIGYRDQLNLEKGQLIKLNELSEETKEQIAVAKEKYLAELAEIKKSSKLKLRSSLRAKQFEVREKQMRSKNRNFL